MQGIKALDIVKSLLIVAAIILATIIFIKFIPNVYELGYNLGNIIKGC